MLIFAHRGGARSRRQENSLAAFRAALDAGCQLETDARISSDGAAVLVHDAVLRRCPMMHRVRKRTAAQLARAGVPTVDDLYAGLGTEYELSVDVKVPEVGKLLLVAAARAGAADKLWLVSDQLDLLRRLRDDSGDVRLVHESHASSIKDPRDHSDRLAAAGVSAQNTALRGWTAEAVAYSHACGVLAFGSLVNDGAGFERGRTLGIDALYTDRLDLAGAVAR